MKNVLMNQGPLVRLTFNDKLSDAMGLQMGKGGERRVCMHLLDRRMGIGDAIPTTPDLCSCLFLYCRWVVGRGW